VTVVIPAHDAEAFLADALDSVVAQTYADWEAVVADDASSDGTPAIASRYAATYPERIRAIHLERNSGPAVARNAAIAASGPTELIALLDADDRWRHDYLEHMVAVYDRAVAAGRRVGIVACDAVLESAAGPLEETLADQVGWVDPITYESMLDRSTIFVSAVFPRAAFDEVGGFSPECWGSEDFDLWLRIIERGYDVVATREPVAIYRLHEGGLSRSQLTMAEAGIAAYRRAYARANSSRRRRATRSRIVHYRALLARALLADALARRRWFEAAGLVVRHSPVAVAAVLQAPGRWREWGRELVGSIRGARRASTLSPIHSETSRR